MRVGKRTKHKLKYAPRQSKHEVTIDGRYRPRDNALYYKDYCCRGCYFDWGRWFEKRHMYQHDCAESNYDGLLKKYWVSPSDYREEDLVSYDTETSTETPTGN